ncbi:protein transport protein Sec16A-like isoform X4 [Penaeus japonicus]|uniref:protein transport protein Sec16A-like isoform X4 n=1 Tax=Penaeus japonicus TaxID=27405 RepID=UPI001C70D1EE|nr:protein transport protein Sec16A-like isoform X4 [Penaeus japonicus]
MVQLSEDGGVPGPTPSPHDRHMMMQQSQLTGDNRPELNQHHAHLAPARPSANLPPSQDHHRGLDSCGNGAASNNGYVASGNGREVSSAGDQIGVGMSADAISRFSSEPHQSENVKMRNERPHPDSRRQPPPRDRWTYYGDPRIRQDQAFLRDSKDERREIRRDPRDYRDRRELDRRDPRDYRGPRDDRKDPRDYRDRRDLDRRDPRDYRDRRDPREEGSYGRDDRRDPRSDRRDPRGERGGPRSDTRGHRGDMRETRDDKKARENYQQERNPEGEGAPAVEGHEVGDGHNHFSEGGPGTTPGKAEVFEAKSAVTGKAKERHAIGERGPEVRREREREHNPGVDRGRERDLGRDPEHEPLRREPVGEETGYESDHSRMSRTTAMTGYSTSSRSFNWRPRADSVASQASVFSHASARPPPTPGRSSRGYEDPYGSRDVYDQYQYYYQYYRDNPYYKEYYRQWMKQYGHAYASESFYDDRTSIHSGRSSVNDELKKSISSPRAAYDPYGYYYGHQSQPPHNSSGELSGVPSVTDDAPSEAPQRMTPVQFGRPHISASFMHGGQLLMVLPKDPREGEKAVVQLRDVQKMLCLDPSIKETIQQMKNYPGPLTLADTHKEVVVRYCDKQVAEAANNPSLNDRESVVLIWEYLALLVKQNGKLLGSDIASLLLKGREVSSHTQQVTPNTTPDETPNTPASDSSPQDEGIDMHSQTSPPTAAKDESLLLKKFSEYLCLGRKREAVDYAMREGLWGHALALSYKMDGTTHTRVLAAFSNSISRTDVLQTLFQQLSGKRPEITKSYNVQQWGDWRQHLAMMVSNPTGHTQRDRASIVALGDTMASRGQLHAAHFCYLVAEAEWGTYSNKSSQLVLIGSSHNLPFQAFSTNEAIQCTEVYEFARSLDSSNPVLETFQSYKLIYALRLTEYGFPSEALRYCEVISQLVSKTAVSYPVEFLSQVYELASRLKYHDLHYQMCEGELLEMPDPKWLSHLHELVEAAKHKETINATEVNQDYAESSINQNVSVNNYYQQAPSIETNEVHGTYHQDMITDEYHQGSHGSYQGHVAAVDTMDGGQQNCLPVSQPPLSQPSTEGLDMSSMQNEMHQPSDGASQPMESATPQIPMMQPQQDQSGYVPYDTSYWSGYQQVDPHMTPFTQAESAKEMSSLPPSSDVNGEHLSSGVTSFSQPNSISSYPAYQQPPYQPWEQPTGTPTMSPEPDEPQLNSVSQANQEEEPHSTDGPGKKGDKNKEGVESKIESHGASADQTPKFENKAKRVSFKSRAELKEDCQRDEEKKTSSMQQTRSGVEAKSRASAVHSCVSMASRHRQLEQNGLSLHPVQHFPGRVTNMEIMAALPANHPERVLPPSRLPHSFSSPLLPMSCKMKIPSNPLVFGGSYPIDDPISPRQLGSGNVMPKAALPTPHTYQVDTICCQAPNLCDEHARLGRDTEIARAEARMQVAQCDDYDDDYDDDSEEEPATLASVPAPVTSDHSNSTCVSKCIYHPYQSHSSHNDGCQSCTCSQVGKVPPPYSAVITYPVDRNVEDGLIPIITDDDDDYDYQDEEYDEFGGDVYEYEDEDENKVGLPEPDYETGYQLRHRHLNSSVSGTLISSVDRASPSKPTLQLPTTFQLPSPPQPLSSSQPSLSDEGTEINLIKSVGFPSAEPTGPASQTVLTTPPLFQPPPHSTQQMSSPPPLGPNNHVTQNTTSADDEQKSDSKKNEKDADKDKSQEKGNTWSISSIFSWKKSKQAILPDDKNPSIVWDEAKKKWVNQDGEEEVAAPPPPPPKSPMGGSGGPPVMKMRGLKKSRYVNTEKDTLQPNSGGMNQNFMMPPGASPPPPPPGPILPPQFMVPEPKDNYDDTRPQKSSTPHQQDPQQPVPQQQQQPAVPLPPEVSQMRRSRYISESSIELEDDWPPTNTEGMLNDGADGTGTVPMMAPPSMQPQFFNPAQFTPATSSSSHPARRPGPGRRAYPVKR